MTAQAIADFKPLFKKLAKDYDLTRYKYQTVLEGKDPGLIARGQRWVQTSYLSDSYHSLDMFADDSIELLAFARGYSPAVLRESGLAEVIKDFLYLATNCLTETRNGLEDFIYERHYDLDDCPICTDRHCNDYCTVASDEADLQVPTIGTLYVDRFDAYMAADTTPTA